LTLALPSAVLAFSSGVTVRPVTTPAHDDGLSQFRTPSVDPALAQAISMRMAPKGQAFRFTPAGSASRPDRSITVAVRVDPDTARAITVRAALSAPAPSLGTTPLRITPTIYNLGVSRGYEAFSQGTLLTPDIRKIEMPDLATFKATGTAKNPGRFAPRLAMDEREKTGRSPGTYEGIGEQTVDLGGSYRLTGNLNVTAGVRYSQDRDRLAPLTDGKQDAQAVYVGTQFRF
jgi:hypothetical protein